MRISKRDWAQLSAYLDGELNSRETKKMRERIVGNPDFQAALEDLRTVKTVLSHTPRLSVPRNFALRRSLVEIPRRSAPVRGYSLAAAVLSFLFIGTVVVDVGTDLLKGGLSAAQAPRAEEVMLEVAADEMEEPVLLAKEAEVAEEIAPAAEMESDAEVPDPYAAGEEGEFVGMAEGETTAAPSEAERATNAGEDSEAENSQDLMSTQAPFEELDMEGTPWAPEQETEQITESTAFPWMIILESALGLGAVGFGVAAWQNRRRNRKPGE